MTPTDTSLTGLEEEPEHDYLAWLATLIYLKDGHLTVFMGPPDILAVQMLPTPHQLTIASHPIDVEIETTDLENAIIRLQVIGNIGDLPSTLEPLELDGYSVLLYIPPDDRTLFQEKLSQV